MEVFYDLIRFFHVISFVFMCVLLFNLIVANERVLHGISYNFNADKHIETIIKSGVVWCYINQLTILITGLLLLILGHLGFEALWTDWIILAKTIIILVLMGTISLVHFKLQPKIESLFTALTTDSKITDEMILKLRPYRLWRKWMTTFYLFLVIVAVILGIQVYEPFTLETTIALIVLTGLFSLFADKIFLRFGWI